MNNLDPTLVAAALVTVLSSLGGTLILIINAWSAREDRREAASERRAQFERTGFIGRIADETNKKADTIIAGNGEIHALANSTNSNLQRAFDVLTEKLAGSERMLAQMIAEKAATLAGQLVTDAKVNEALRSQPPGGTTAPDPLAGAAVVDSLDNIDKHTAAIDRNTK